MRKRILMIIVALAVVVVSFVTIHPGEAHAYVAGDPYATGCSNNARAVNGGPLNDPLHPQTQLAYIENWYSYSCNTNWVLVYYDASKVAGTLVDIHRQGGINDPVGSTHQCYPTNCASHYYGGLSPTWTDMVDGQYYDCVWVHLLLPFGREAGTGTDDFCA